MHLLHLRMTVESAAGSSNQSLIDLLGLVDIRLIQSYSVVISVSIVVCTDIILNKVVKILLIVRHACKLAWSPTATGQLRQLRCI